MGYSIERACRVAAVAAVAIIFPYFISNHARAQGQPGVEVVPVIPHSGRIKVVTISADGRNILSGASDNVIKLWNAETGRLVRTFSGHSDQVFSVAFSPDGLSMISAGMDKELMLWNVSTGAHIRTLVGHTSWASSVSYSPDGTKIVSGGMAQSFGGQLIVWDVASGVPLLNMEPDSWVHSVAFSPNGVVLASGGWRVQVWDATSGQLRQTLQGDLGGMVTPVGFSRDGTQIVAGGANRLPPVRTALLS